MQILGLEEEQERASLSFEARENSIKIPIIKMILRRALSCAVRPSSLQHFSILSKTSLRFFGSETTSNFEVIELESADDFEKYAQSEQPVIVDFYGQWCGPCKVLFPKLKILAQSHDLKLLKIDAEKFEDIAEAIGVSSLPTVHLVRSEESLASFQGLKDEEFLEKWVKEALNI